MTSKLERDRRAKESRRKTSRAQKITALSPDLTQALEPGVQVTQDEVDRLFTELTTFSGVSDDYRRSDEYYYQALAKILDIYQKIAGWPAERQVSLYRMLNLDGKTVRGNGLHVLLRTLLPTETDDQSGHRRRSRDASALAYMIRKGWAADGVERKIKGAGGVDKLSRLEAEARAADRAAAVVLADSVAVDNNSHSADASLAPAASSETDAKIRTRWKSMTKKRLLSDLHVPHDVMIIARVDPFERAIDIRSAYPTQFGKLTPKAEAEIIRVLADAGHVRREGVGKRSKRTAE